MLRSLFLAMLLGAWTLTGCGDDDKPNTACAYDPEEDDVWECKEGLSEDECSDKGNGTYGFGENVRCDELMVDF